jgi:hypothetical protein
LTTAEGEAHLQGQIGVPVDLWLNKYAGPSGGQKGLRIYLRDGRIISHDRRGAEDVLEHIDGEDIQRWHVPGSIYEHCLAGHILGSKACSNAIRRKCPARRNAGLKRLSCC